ncbi:MAG TPA: hypothetical protein VF230_18060 [Acidimicrobiales bacterium]
MSRREALAVEHRVPVAAFRAVVAESPSPATGGEPEPSQPVLIGVARDVSGRHERLHDVAAYEDRLVVTPLRGANPETVGGILGLLFGGLVGSGAGRVFGRRVIRRRAARRAIERKADDVVPGHTGEPVTVPAASIERVHVRHRVDGAVVTVDAGGERHTFRSRAAVTSGADVVDLATRLAGDRVEVRPVGALGRVTYYATRAVTAAVAVAMLVGIAVAITTTFAADPDPLEGTATPAVAAATRACGPWNAMGTSQGQPSRDRVKDAVDDMRADMDRAAAADTRFVDAARALSYMQAVLSLPPELAAVQDAQRMATAATTVDVTCSLVG